MRILWLLLLVLFLLAACHRGSKQPPADTVPKVDTLPSLVDSSSLVFVDSSSAKPQTKPTKAQTTKFDTAETTNLRIFARKQRTIYNPALLEGVWHRDSEHEEYLSGGKGRYWDTKDDVSHEEAQSFRWSMDSNLLFLEFHLALGGVFYRQYVVTFVDDETLVYRDAFDKSYMWDKVIEDSDDD